MVQFSFLSNFYKYLSNSISCPFLSYLIDTYFSNIFYLFISFSFSKHSCFQIFSHIFSNLFTISSSLSLSKLGDLFTNGLINLFICFQNSFEFFGYYFTSLFIPFSFLLSNSFSNSCCYNILNSYIFHSILLFLLLFFFILFKELILFLYFFNSSLYTKKLYFFFPNYLIFALSTISINPF